MIVYIFLYVDIFFSLTHMQSKDVGGQNARFFLPFCCCLILGKSVNALDENVEEQASEVWLLHIKVLLTCFELLSTPCYSSIIFISMENFHINNLFSKIHRGMIHLHSERLDIWL